MSVQGSNLIKQRQFREGFRMPGLEMKVDLGLFRLRLRGVLGWKLAGKTNRLCAGCPSNMSTGCATVRLNVA